MKLNKRRRNASRHKTKNNLSADKEAALILRHHLGTKRNIEDKNYKKEKKKLKLLR